MHIDKINLMEDREEIVAFMKRFSFATIVTSKNELPIATHLPFVIHATQESIILSAHFAKANPQWKTIEDQNVLVIFSEPHAYISPKNYKHQLNVPTWNYIAVHAYGKGILIHDLDQALELLEDTILNYEHDFLKQWNQLPTSYKLNMVKEIMPFKITITELQANKKLSQNKSASERKSIIDNLSSSKNSNETLTAEYMKANESKIKQ